MCGLLYLEAEMPLQLQTFLEEDGTASCLPRHHLRPLTTAARPFRPHSQAIATVLSDSSIALLTSVEDDLWEETLEEQVEAQPWTGPGLPQLLPRVLALDAPALEAATATGSGAVQTAAWVGEGRLLLVVGISSSGSELLVELEVDAAAGTAVEVAAIDSGVPPLLCCTSRPGPAGGVLLQQHSGRLLLYSAGGVLQPLPAAAGFPCGCQQMAATPAAAAGLEQEGLGPAAPAAFGLNARGQLYWGSRQLAADVTSFVASGRVVWGQRGLLGGWCYVPPCRRILPSQRLPQTPPPCHYACCSCGTAGQAAHTFCSPRGSTCSTPSRSPLWLTAALSGCCQVPLPLPLGRGASQGRSTTFEEP